MAETVASSRLGLSKTWHIFYHKTWITVTWREAAWAWPRAGEGAHNAKFTHQHNTVPSITSILSPQSALLLITNMIKVTEISDNLKHDHRRSS